MARWYGEVGFSSTEETTPGVYTEVIVTKTYNGDLIKQTVRRADINNSSNKDLDISNRISFVADPFAYAHFGQIRYATFGGYKWEVSDVDVDHPRITISLGGVYNDGNN